MSRVKKAVGKTHVLGPGKTSVPVCAVLTAHGQPFSPPSVFLSVKWANYPSLDDFFFVSSSLPPYVLNSELSYK